MLPSDLALASTRSIDQPIATEEHGAADKQSCEPGAIALCLARCFLDEIESNGTDEYPRTESHYETNGAGMNRDQQSDHAFDYERRGRFPHYFAAGYAGQSLTVIPHLRLVAVTTGEERRLRPGWRNPRHAVTCRTRRPAVSNLADQPLPTSRRRTNTSSRPPSRD